MYPFDAPFWQKMFFVGVVVGVSLFVNFFIDACHQASKDFKIWKENYFKNEYPKVKSETNRIVKDMKNKIFGKVMCLGIIGMFVISGIMIFIPQEKQIETNKATIQSAWTDFLGEMSFTREPRNPLMYATETWEGVEIGDYSVHDDVSNFVMFYTGFRYDAVANGIGRATAPPEYPMTNWTKYGKVFEGNATPGQWDSGSVRLGSVFKDNGTWYMYYGATPAIGFAGGPVKIGLATSTDELTWTRVGNGNPVLVSSGDETNVEDPAVIRMSATSWYMYYSYRTAGDILPGIRVASSPDGKTWTKIGEVISRGTYGSWDDTFIEHSNVYYVENHFVLLFEAYGGSGSEPWQLGIAYSTTPTSGFVKYSGNPIFSPSHEDGAFDEFHVDTPYLFNHDNDWYLFFGGADGYIYSPSNWQMGIAYSPGTSAMIPAPQIKLWTAGGASTASTSASWTPVGVPRNGDYIVLNLTSSQNINWDLTNVRPKSVSLNTGYLGTFTLSVNPLNVDDFYLNNGTITASNPDYIYHINHNFIRTNGNVAGGGCIIVMEGNGGILDGGHGYGITFRPYAIIFEENTTLIGDWVRVSGWFQVVPNRILTISANSNLVLDTWVSARMMYNDGIIQGNGYFVFHNFQTKDLPSYYGTINSNAKMMLEPVSSYNPTVKLKADLTIGGSLEIIGNTDHYNLLDLNTSGNYDLSANGITIGFHGQINPAASTITNSGNWDSSLGIFTQGSSKLIMTKGKDNTGTLEIGASWTANANSPITFTVTELTVSKHYHVYVDNAEKYGQSGQTELNYTYSTWDASHKFEVLESSFLKEHPVYGMLALLIVLASAITMGLLFINYKEELTLEGIIIIVVGLLVGIILIVIGAMTFWSV